MGILVADHPPFSLDMNPIEHLWFHLKKIVQQQYLELTNIGSGEDAKRALERALDEAWQLIPDKIFMAVLESIPKRVKALIEAEGWYTKY